MNNLKGIEKYKRNTAIGTCQYLNEQGKLPSGMDVDDCVQKIKARVEEQAETLENNWRQDDEATAEGLARHYGLA